MAQRRRIKTEEKAKVVAAVWGDKFIQFLAAQAFMPRTILKKDEFILFFQIILVQFILLLKIVKAKQLARQGIE